jgi:hypothetical protein
MDTTITDCKLSSKLTGVPELVLARLQGLLEDYLTNSDDPEVNPPKAKQRSVKPKLKIVRNDKGDIIRVVRKEKNVTASHYAMIDSILERSRVLLKFYFPTPAVDWAQLDNSFRVALTLKFIMQPLSKNVNGPAKSYVVSYPAVLEVCISKQVLGTGNRRGSRLRTRYILAVSHGHVQVHPSPLLRRPLRLQKGFHDTPETVIQHDSNERQRYFRRDTKYSN